MLFIIGAVDSAPARTYTVDTEENVMQVIDSFGGEYSFLSNFHKCKVEFEGMTYHSVEHAFQAAKNPDPEYRRRASPPSVRPSPPRGWARRPCSAPTGRK